MISLFFKPVQKIDLISHRKFQDVFASFMKLVFIQPIINRIIQMNYQNHSYYPNSHNLESRVKQLEADKQHLSTTIEELNHCYQEKIQLLEATIGHQQQRYEELLEWKQNYISRGLFEVEKYQTEIKKMIEILDNAHNQFESKQESLEQEIHNYRMEIQELKDENEALNQFNTQNESKIEEMVRTYTEEIEKLKEELKMLREESICSEESSLALREISTRHNLENIAPNQKVNFSMEVDPSFSKFSVTTGSE